MTPLFLLVDFYCDFCNGFCKVIYCEQAKGINAQEILLLWLPRISMQTGLMFQLTLRAVRATCFRLLAAACIPLKTKSQVPSHTIPPTSRQPPLSPIFALCFFKKFSYPCPLSPQVNSHMSVSLSHARLIFTAKHHS